LGELPLLEFQEGGSYLFVEQAHVDVVFGQRKFKIAHNKVVSILSVLEIFDFVMLYLLETTAGIVYFGSDEFLHMSMY